MCVNDLTEKIDRNVRAGSRFGAVASCTVHLYYKEVSQRVLSVREIFISIASLYNNLENGIGKTVTRILAISYARIGLSYHYKIFVYFFIYSLDILAISQNQNWMMSLIFNHIHISPIIHFT